MVAPTGSGKTVIFTRFLEDLRARNALQPTLIVVPSLVLKSQTEQALATHGFGGKVRQANANRVERGSVDVTIMTQQAFARYHEGSGSYRPKQFGLVIFDEAHHMQGEQTQLVLKLFPHAAIVGFTATPDYDKKRLLTNILPDKIHEITITEAIDAELITPYQTILLPTAADMRYVIRTGKDYHQGMLDRAVNTDTRNQLITRFYTETMRGVPTMFNVNKINHGLEMAQLLRRMGNKAVAVHGGMDKNEQAYILKSFAGGDIDILVQARLLGEGYDEPRIEAVMNVTPTLSLVRAQQRVGRAQRVDVNNPGKITRIVECVDQTYATPPLLYGSEKVAGYWNYPGDDSRQLDLASIAADTSFNPVTDTETIQRWHQGLESLPHGFVGTDEQLHDMWGYSEVFLDLPFQKIRAERNSVTTPRIPRENTAIQKKAYLHIAERRSHTHKDTFLEDVYGDVDAQQSAREVVVALRDERQQHLAQFVISGTALTDQDMSQSHIRAVLRQLAGTPELQDSAILHRYQTLNTLLHQNGIEPKHLLDAITPGGAHLNGVSLISSGVKVPERFSHKDAACTPAAVDNVEAIRNNVDQFFPDRGESVRPSKQQCVGCTALSECLNFALDNNLKHGVWGGMSERQRRRIRRVPQARRSEAIEKTWNSDSVMIRRIGSPVMLAETTVIAGA